jgi:ubiquitin carboxyl-terminal hydrolase L3
MYTDLHFTCFVTAPDGIARKAAEENRHASTVEEESTVVTEGSAVAVTQVLKSESSVVEPASNVTAPSPRSFTPLFATNTTPEEGQLEGMRLIELDGRRPFPIDHGPCTDVLDVRIRFFFSSQ